MSGIGSLFSGSHYGSPIADVAQASMRPTFELQFSLLQNQVIDRLNKEIEATNGSGEKVDAFLLLEKARLDRVSEGMDKFRIDASRNHNLMADISDLMLEGGDAALSSAASGDSTDFDALLAKINTMADRLISLDGSTTGIMFEDGVRSIKNNGLVRYTDGSGASQKATSYADFATAADATTALSDAVDRLIGAQTLTDLKIETVVDMQGKVGERIIAASLDIQVAQSSGQAEKAKAVAGLRDKYAQMLNALSIGFEGAAAQSEYFAKHLLAPTEVDRGSVMNLFT